MTHLIQGDSVDKMKALEDNSVNLVLTDPPYNICHRSLDWDKKRRDYVDFMIIIFKEAYRVLTKKGSLYFFHNDFKQMAQLQVDIESKTNFKFQRLITLTKDSYITKLYPNCKSWINCCEYVLVYVKDEIREEKQIEYFIQLHKAIGKSKSTIRKDIPHADHCFRVSKSNFALPTQETYDKIISLYNLKDTKDLEELRELKYPINYVYNGKSQANYLHVDFKKGKMTTHPCEKPQALLMNLIKTASNENDVVLDMFMGCGSTGIACKSSNRQFIGIELDPHYFEEAERNITG